MVVHRFRLLAAFSILFIFSSNGLARQDSVPGSRYTSARAAALGGAFLGLADDGASGLMYNPAALGKLKRPHFEPLNFQFMFNSGVVSTFTSSVHKATSLPSISPVLAENPQLGIGSGASIFPNFSFRGFGFGFLYQAEMLGKDLGNGDIRYRSLYQLIPTAGGAIRLARGIVRIGYSVQWVNQASGDVTVATTSASGYSEGLNKGSALSHNLGFALTFPFRLLPAFNIVARNIGGAKFKDTSIVPLTGASAGSITSEEMTIDASFSVKPKTGKGSHVDFIIEGKDLTNRSGMTLLKRISGGLEFSFREKFYLRGGYGSGYPSAGIGIKSRRASFSLTWYSEELGTSAVKDRDTRFLIQYQIKAF